MIQSAHQSIRILFDLQACQTPWSARRGVGRYSCSLFGAVRQMAGQDADIWGLCSAGLPQTLDVQGRMVSMPALPAWGSARDYSGGNQDSLDAALYDAQVAKICSDIVHLSHVFEGYTDRLALPGFGTKAAGQVLATTLYDLIPLRFPQVYFRDPAFKAWYLHRVQWLRQADVLLAISDTSKQDAVNLLGIPSDRIVTVYGGISDHFKPTPDASSAYAVLARKYKLTRAGFVLYTGGDEYRKNLLGAIQAFAALPKDVRDTMHLVVVCAMQDHRKTYFADEVRRAGLDSDDVRFLGYTPEEDLVALYGTCAAFFFPSLYEGLGLPVLEAMACGAPVLASDNSSLRELVVRKDAMFQADDPRSIAQTLESVLRNPDFAAELRAYGLKRHQEFTWEKTAEKTLAAYDDALARKRAAANTATLHGGLPRHKVAVLTPLPPTRSGIADYNASFLPFLARYFDLDIYVRAGGRMEDDALGAAFRIYDAADFERNASAYDCIWYEIGNSEFHEHMLPLLKKYPGVVGLHDAYLSGLMGCYEFGQGKKNAFSRAMLESHGPLARRHLLPSQAEEDGVRAATNELPCTKSVLDQATGIISHARFNLDLARRFYPQGWRAPYRIIPQMVRVPAFDPQSRAAARQARGFKDTDFVCCTFGHVAWTKWGDRLLRAFLHSAAGQNPDAYLVFVGDLSKDAFGASLADAIKQSGLGPRVRVTGYQSDAEYEEWLQVADFGVQLRTKSRGGTPKGVLDCMAHAVPVAVNNDASYTDYSDEVVLKLPPDPSVAEISALIDAMYQDAPRRLAQGAAGLGYVRAHHDPSVIAAEYAAFIHECIARNRANAPVAHASRMAPYIAACESRMAAAQMAATFLDGLQPPSFARQRLVVAFAAQTQIQPAHAQILRALYMMEQAGVEPVLALLDGAGLRVARDWLNANGVLLPAETQGQSDEALPMQAGDCLVLLDASAQTYAEFAAVREQLRGAGALTVCAFTGVAPAWVMDTQTLHIPYWDGSVERVRALGGLLR